MRKPKGMKSFKSMVALVTLCIPSVLAHAALAADFDVLVNSSVTESSMTKEDVKQLLLTNKLTWGDGKKVVIVTLAPDADQADAIAKDVLGMTSLQAKKFYLTKVFNGVLSASPQTGDSGDDVAEAVAKTPGAIAVVPKGTKPGKAKLVQVK